MKQQLYQAEWLGLDQKLRDKLKEIFAINRSEGMSVVNGQLVSDGCSQNDLTQGVTIGKMIDYLSDMTFEMNTDNPEKIFDELFGRVINKANGTKELNSNTKKDEKAKDNKGTESKDKRTKTESKGDKQTIGKGNDRSSGDDSINAGSGDRQDIQRPKIKDESKRTGNTSGKGTVKSKKAR